MHRCLVTFFLLLVLANCSPRPPPKLTTAPKPLVLHLTDLSTVVCFDRPPLNNYLGLPAACFTVGELRQFIAVRYARLEAER